MCDHHEEEIKEESVRILTVSLIRSLTMCDKTMENYKPNMFQLQCLKALEIQIEEGKGYNEAEIGRKMQVNRSTISRCFKRYREE